MQEGGDSGAGMPVRRPIPGWILTKYVGYASYTHLQQQGLDTTTPSGRAMFQMCGVFAEFERAMIKERVKAGLARAKA